MSQLYAELTEQAAQLGFHSVEEAEINGYKVDYEKQELVPDVDQAYSDKEEEERKNREAKQVEAVWKILGNAKEAIAMVFKPENNTYSRPADDITDEKINQYYYDLNRMCIELSDRNVMLWQKEDNENQN
jgi:hypothetical protein